MKTIKNFLLILVGIAIGWYGHALSLTSGEVAVTDFETCVTAGNPVMESFPRQCKTPEGDTYVEEITEVSLSNMIIVETPQSGQTATSSLYVSGSARGNWYFEASFPVVLKDNSGNIIAQAPAQAQGEWMTTEFVPFGLLLSFEKQATVTPATLILQRDNPSGLPEYDAQFEIPVVLIP